MSEEKGEYRTTTDESQEAMNMLGKGYEHASVVITPPHTVMERRGNEFKEVIVPAFVKISTDFKEEMAGIDEIALKVWLYIALSVNRYSEKANPGLRTIAQGTGFAINTVQSALKRLESKYNLLTVDRESRKYNIYEPVAFISANRKDPVSPDDTDQESVSDEPQSVSVESESVSARMILNQSNQSEPELINSIAKSKNPQSLEWLITGGASKEEVETLLENEKQAKIITDAFEKSMGFNPLPWGKLDRLKKFLLTKTVGEIQTFAAWSLGKYSGLSPAKARQNPDMVIDLWPQAFISHPEPKTVKRGDNTEFFKQLAIQAKKENPWLQEKKLLES